MNTIRSIVINDLDVPENNILREIITAFPHEIGTTFVSRVRIQLEGRGLKLVRRIPSDTPDEEIWHVRRFRYGKLKQTISTVTKFTRAVTRVLSFKGGATPNRLPTPVGLLRIVFEEVTMPSAAHLPAFIDRLTDEGEAEFIERAFVVLLFVAREFKFEAHTSCSSEAVWIVGHPCK